VVAGKTTTSRSKKQAMSIENRRGCNNERGLSENKDRACGGKGRSITKGRSPAVLNGKKEKFYVATEGSTPTREASGQTSQKGCHGVVENGEGTISLGRGLKKKSINRENPCRLPQRTKCHREQRKSSSGGAFMNKSKGFKENGEERCHRGKTVGRREPRQSTGLVRRKRGAVAKKRGKKKPQPTPSSDEGGNGDQDCGEPR